MNVRRVQNPFDVTGWTSEIELVEYTVDAFAPDTSVDICDTDPRRLWIIAATEPATGGFVMWPRRQTAEYGIAPITGQTHVLVHNASYPSLVQGGWWFRCALAGITVHVIIGRDMN